MKDDQTATPLNYRALAALRGDGNWTINIAEDLARLLESGDPICAEVRSEMAAALRRLPGDPGLRLAIAGHGAGSDHDAMRAMRVRMNWLQAGKAIIAASEGGLKNAHLEIGPSYGLDEKQARKAKAEYRKFLVWLESAASTDHRSFAEKLSNMRQPQDGADYLESAYVEIVAGIE